MPDTRKHRGAHPEDRKLFGEALVPVLREAVRDLSWLLSRGYAPKAALRAVGDRYRLNERQRSAVARASCSDKDLDRRRDTRLEPAEVKGSRLALDGFNFLITVEAALSGALLLTCRDGCTRDIASIHGSYRSVEETEPAIRLIGDYLQTLEPATVRWLLDSPISNSGRLAVRLRELAAEHGWAWTVETPFNPDTVLLASDAIVVSSDSMVLNGAGRWADLVTPALAAGVRDVWRVDLRENYSSPENCL